MKDLNVKIVLKQNDKDQFRWRHMDGIIKTLQTNNNFQVK